MGELQNAIKAVLEGIQSGKNQEISNAIVQNSITKNQDGNNQQTDSIKNNLQLSTLIAQQLLIQKTTNKSKEESTLKSIELEESK